MPVHFIFEKETGNIIHLYLKAGLYKYSLLIENLFEIYV